MTLPTCKWELQTIKFQLIVIDSHVSIKFCITTLRILFKPNINDTIDTIISKVTPSIPSVHLLIV